MHDVIENELESYLSGTASGRFHAHLKECGDCRREVGAMQGLSGLFSELRSEDAPSPTPGFYVLLKNSLEARRPSFWDIFSIDPAFARRIAFSSLMMLAILGGFLVSREAQYTPVPAGPEAILAHDTSAAHESGAADRDRMLVTLASYQQ